MKYFTKLCFSLKLFFQTKTDVHFKTLLNLQRAKSVWTYTAGDVHGVLLIRVFFCQLPLNRRSSCSLLRILQ